MKLFDLENYKQKNGSIQSNTSPFYLTSGRFSPLFQIIFSLFSASVLVLAGGSFLFLARLVGFVLAFTLVSYIARVGIRIFGNSPKQFFTVLACVSLYVYLTFRNYAIVIYGGQDPGYYQIYADLLSQGFGAKFDSNAFENFSNTGVYSLWSTSSNLDFSEIQFYPLMPATLSLLIPIFGLNAYPVLGILANLMVVCIFYDYLFSRKKLNDIFLPLIWLFVPATIWFSRIPASEVLSIPLLLVALLLPFVESKKTNVMVLNYFLLSACLFLCRANPLLPISLVLGILWSLVLARSSSHIIIDFAKKLLAILAGSATGILLYMIFQPTFWVILLVELRNPSLAAFVFLLVAVCLTLFLKTAPISPFISEFKISGFFSNFTRFIPVQIFFLVNFYVLFSEPWGVYKPDNFGISSSIYQRAGHTPFLFLLFSLGFTFFLFKVRNTSIQVFLCIVLTIFILAVAVRSPGIPYSYYFQRYWWSEICLLVLAIIITSSDESSISKSKQRMAFRNSLVFLTIFFQVIAFNIKSTNFTETGTQTTSDLRALSNYLNSQTYEFAFTSGVSPEFTSGVIIPLRYHFQNIVSRIDTATFDVNKLNGILLISDIPCANETQQHFQSIQLKRLRGIGDFGLGDWINEERQVYICNPKGNLKP